MRYHAVLVLLAILLVLPAIVPADVVHGYTNLLSIYISPYGNFDEAFDFATQSIVSWDTSPTADISFSLDAQNRNPTIELKNCIGAASEVSLGSLVEAPDGLAPLGGANLHIDQTIVAKTGDNLYVKFAARSTDGYGIRIEYYVQMDGSPSFGPILATQPSTWGSVKALYR